jgi:formylglycine-generating enzyme required for sulfatase activity
MRGLAAFALAHLACAAPASAQTSPGTDARIAAYAQESNALAAADAARPRPDPNAALLARSRGLSAAQQAEAQSIFGSAFTVWQAGDYASAEIGFRRGLEIDPANGAANFYMGDISRRRGDTSAAYNYLTRAMTFAPNSAEGLRAEGALRDLPASITDAPTVFAPQAPQVTFRDCANCPEMITIPAGYMQYGLRRVVIAPIAVGRFEVTFDQWAACVRGGGCASNPNPNDEGWGRGNRPVINVSWNHAQEYVHWLSRTTGQTYRLLSAAEWEFAARADTATAFWWGDQDPVCDQNARNGANFRACTDDRSRPVGSFAAAVNAFGLYDVHGNVWEWVEDCHVATDCSSRVLRGGSWFYGREGLHVAVPIWYRTTFGISGSGLRVARTL